MCSKNQGAIVHWPSDAKLRDGSTVQSLSAAQDPWFYLHVQNPSPKMPATNTEAIPLPEYLFRYRQGFWVWSLRLLLLQMSLNRLTRWCEHSLHTRMRYTALHASESPKYVVQDLACPYPTAEQFVNTQTRNSASIRCGCAVQQSPYPDYGNPQFHELEVRWRGFEANVRHWTLGFLDRSNHMNFHKIGIWNEVEERVVWKGGFNETSYIL